ncbi:meiosis-specific coiled-coil domain-containing protein MEIOC [Trichonephila clavipes]|nr:meiosis-specific coiled-coil domain-containing protein MEIOC [Trichonephila clavipes]
MALQTTAPYGMTEGFSVPRVGNDGCGLDDLVSKIIDDDNLNTALLQEHAELLGLNLNGGMFTTPNSCSNLTSPPNNVWPQAKCNIDRKNNHEFIAHCNTVCNDSMCYSEKTGQPQHLGPNFFSSSFDHENGDAIPMNCPNKMYQPPPPPLWFTSVMLEEWYQVPGSLHMGTSQESVFILNLLISKGNSLLLQCPRVILKAGSSFTWRDLDVGHWSGVKSCPIKPLIPRHPREIYTPTDGSNCSYEEWEAFNALQKPEGQLNEIFNETEFRFPDLDNNPVCEPIDQQDFGKQVSDALNMANSAASWSPLSVPLSFPQQANGQANSSISNQAQYTELSRKQYPAGPPLGRGSLVVKVSDRGWLVTSLSPVRLKTHLVGE